jgi:hypothetical protein
MQFGVSHKPAAQPMLWPTCVKERQKPKKMDTAASVYAYLPTKQPVGRAAYQQLKQRHWGACQGYRMHHDVARVCALVWARHDLRTALEGYA